MKSLTKLGLVGASLLCLAASQVRADLILYDNASAFEAGVLPGYYLNNFNDIVPGTSYPSLSPSGARLPLVARSATQSPQLLVDFLGLGCSLTETRQFQRSTTRIVCLCQ